MRLLIPKANYSKILFLLVLLVVGCSKDKGDYYTAVYGQVLDYDTGEPIPVVLVILQDGFNSGYDIYPMSTSLIDTAYTDINGRFFVEIKNHFFNAYISSKKMNYSSFYTSDGYQPILGGLEPGIYPDFIIRKKRNDND